MIFEAVRKVGSLTRLFAERKATFPNAALVSVFSASANPFVRRRLAKTLFDFDSQKLRLEVVSISKFVKKSSGEPLAEQLRRGVLDGKQNAVFARKDPFAILEANANSSSGFFQLDEGIFRRQEHSVVEFVGDLPTEAFQSHEVEDVPVLVEFPADFDGRAVIVTVQMLALVAIIGDEVPTAKDKVILRDSDVKTLLHNVFPVARDPSWNRAVTFFLGVIGAIRRELAGVATKRWQSFLSRLPTA